MEQTEQHIIAFSFVCVCVCGGGGGGEDTSLGGKFGGETFFSFGGKAYPGFPPSSPGKTLSVKGTKLVTNDFQLFIQNKCNYLFTVLGRLIHFLMMIQRAHHKVQRSPPTLRRVCVMLKMDLHVMANVLSLMPLFPFNVRQFI